MADILNLRMARKARTRSKAAHEAEANRAKYGASKNERELARREEDRIAGTLAGAKLESGEDKSG